MQKLILLCCFCFFIFLSVFPQTTMKLGNQSLVKENDKWYVLDSDTKYLVNEKSVTVKLKESASKEALSALNKKLDVKIERCNELGYYDLLLPENQNLETVYSHYLNSGIFESVEVNSFGTFFSNDPGFNSQYYLFDYNIDNYPSISASLETISWFEDGSTNPVIVAVVDCGVAYTNTDINMNSKKGYDFIAQPNDTFPYPDDGSFHGTGIAGIIGAKSNNSTATAGISGGDYPSAGARIMSIRIGYFNNGQMVLQSEVVDDAILWAANNGAKIINMSFGCTENTSINNAINYARNSKGCILIAATGNQGNNTITYPASHSYVMGIAGINKNWSNYGNYGTGVDLVAPSEGIYSTLNSGWGLWGDGTSGSSPMVAGVAALLLSNRPGLLPFDVERILKESAINTYSTYDETHDGSGILSATNALYELGEPNPEIPILSINASVGNNPVLSWTSIQGATQYKIYCANSIIGRYNFSLAATTTSTNWVDNSCLVQIPGTSTNYYRVTALISTNESITSNEVSCGTNISSKQAANNPDIVYKFELKNNYPNPFNPTTNINYSIKEKGLVTLEVYDILGRKVTSLVNEIKEAGDYSVMFDAKSSEGGLPSGIYIYSLRAGNYTATQKMLLMK